jgi:hypothetical protein
VSDFEIDHEFPRIGRKKIVLNARRIEVPDHEDTLILISIGDI